MDGFYFLGVGVRRGLPTDRHRPRPNNPPYVVVDLGDKFVVFSFFGFAYLQFRKNLATYQALGIVTEILFSQNQQHLGLNRHL